MIYVAALIIMAYAAVMPLVFALCRVAAEGDRQEVYEPLPAVRSGEGGHAEGKDAPQGCGPREARQNASSVASTAGTGATTQPHATGRAGTPGPGSLRDSTLNAKLARPDRGALSPPFPCIDEGVDWRLGWPGGYVLIWMCSRSIARAMRARP